MAFQASSVAARATSHEKSLPERVGKSFSVRASERTTMTVALVESDECDAPSVSVPSQVQLP